MKPKPPSGGLVVTATTDEAERVNMIIAILLIGIPALVALMLLALFQLEERFGVE